MGELTESLPPPSRSVPFREDCWSEDATATLVDAWGRRFLDLNRGNLRQKDWQDVADAVNSLHGHTKKTRRTDVQCKNRIDTLKKKYKAEKARVLDSNGSVVSTWPFFSRLDVLIGSVPKKTELKGPPVAIALPFRRVSQSNGGMPPPPLAVALPQKRPAPSAAPAVDVSYFRQNYSAMAAAAAAAAEEDELDDDDDEEFGTSEESGGDREKGAREGKVEGMKMLAKAIERFGEMYERVEREKQKQLIELEKQKMQFAKDLEVQRMQLLMDTQVQLEKVKQAKRSGSDDVYS